MQVRWDAVVQDNRFWSEPAQPVSPRQGLTGDVSGEATLKIWLFGRLAELLPERPLTVRLGNPFCVRDIIAELGRRCGDEFIGRVTDTNGARLNHCRIFLNGEPVEDDAAPFDAGGSPAQIEIILLTAAEGG